MGVQSPGSEPLFTPQLVIDALRAARGNVTVAARSLTSPARPNGICRETVYQYIRRQPEIADALRDIRERLGWAPAYPDLESGLEQTLLTWRAAAARG